MFQKTSSTETLENIALNFEKMSDDYIFMKEQFVDFEQDNKIKFNFKEWHIAMCPNGGLIAACKKKGILDITKGSKINKNIIVTYQNLRTKYLIPIDWDYKKTWVVLLDFNEKEQLYAICNDGTIFKIDITTQKAVKKSTSSIFENEPIIKAKLFEKGFIALTLNGDFYYVPDIKNPFPQLFFAMKSLLEFSNEVDFILIPSNFSKSKKLELLITNQTGEGIVHIEQNDNGLFYFLPVENSEILECKGVSILTGDKIEPYYKNIGEKKEETPEFTDESRLKKIKAIALSPSKEQIALYDDRGYVFLMKSNLDDDEERKRVIINLDQNLNPFELLEQQQIIIFEEGTQFLFCGEDAVALCGNRYIYLINSLGKNLVYKIIENEEYNPEKQKIFFKCISEIDGLRILTNEGIYFISRVDNDLKLVCDPFTPSDFPCKQLINSFINSKNKITNSEKNIRNMNNELVNAIYTLQNAAMNIYWRKSEDDVDKKEAQLFLLNAAQHGKFYVEKEAFNFQKFYLNCKKIRAINNLRNNKKKPRLITYQEYKNINSNDLIKFLVRALDFETASKLCLYLEENIKYVYERYTIDCIKRIPNYSKEDEEKVFKILYYKLEKIPDFSFINICKKAFKYHKDTIAFKFLEKEKSLLAKLPNYIDKKQWYQVFELCQNIIDTNILKSIFESIFKDENEISHIIKISGKFPKLKSFLIDFIKIKKPESLDDYINNFKNPEELFFYYLEQYFQVQKISKRKEYLTLARKNQKLIDVNINPNFDHKFYKNYVDSLEYNLKYKLEFQPFIKNRGNTSFDISIYDTYKIGLKDKKNYNIIKSKNGDFGFSNEGLSFIRFKCLAENEDFEGIDELIKNNFNNLKKFSMSYLNMAEIYFTHKQYDKAVKVIKFLSEPIYLQYKLDMLKTMNKLEDSLEIIITDKNIDISNINSILTDIINNNPNLIKKAKEIALKYKIEINLN